MYSDSESEDESEDESAEENPIKPSSIEPKPAAKKSEYQMFISKEIAKQRKLHPGLKTSEYMKLAALEWRKYKENKLNY